LMPIELRLVAVFALTVAGCVSFPEAPAPLAPPALASNAIQTIDGRLLGLKRWPAEDPKAVVLAVHGMNDYSNAFAGAGEWWAENAGLTTYAIDQRGFGASPDFGRWVGAETMKTDLRASVDAVRNAHPDLPLYVLGHSMGAATVIAAEEDASLGADGLILAAPGVWGGDALPLSHRIAANLAAAVAPGKTLTGERAGRQATDNIAILREMSADPLVIKETRLDAVLGVVRLMGEAFDASDGACANALVLIGQKDEIIPRKAMEETASRLCGDVDMRRYPDGWHLLLRDLQRERVWRDIAAWVKHRETRPR
jgi:alpha-beta hydrolase superfamily lysophospholipase